MGEGGREEGRGAKTSLGGRRGWKVVKGGEGKEVSKE